MDRVERLLITNNNSSYKSRKLINLSGRSRVLTTLPVNNSRRRLRQKLPPSLHLQERPTEDNNKLMAGEHRPQILVLLLRTHPQDLDLMRRYLVRILSLLHLLHLPCRLQELCGRQRLRWILA
jgi:hypothetical protein